MGKEEYLFRLSLLQQEANKLNEQINLINQQTEEFEILKLSLDKLGEKKEILACLGKGIFFKAGIEDKDLFVNVGSGVVLKKDKEETKEIINKQIKQLEGLKSNLINEIGKINRQLQELIEEARENEV